MTDNQHLWACALLLERQHGASAHLHASIRADELEGEGAFEGARTWGIILARIETLEGKQTAQIQ